MVNIAKYELILKELALNKSWKTITLELGCSMSTISKSVKWASEGKPISPKKVTTKKELSSVVSSVVSSKIPEIFEINLNEAVLEIDYNSRFLSWMAHVLTIPNYWQLGKSGLITEIIKKVELMKEVK